MPDFESLVSPTGQLDRTITKEQILEDVCTNNEKTKGELKFDIYTFRAKPDIKKCEEYTRLLVNKDHIGKNFGEDIDFEVLSSVELFSLISSRR